MGAWLLVGAAFAFADYAGMIAAAATLALALTALWLAHIFVFALRALKDRPPIAARVKAGPAKLDANLPQPSRRWLVLDFAATLALAAAATVVSRRALAQVACGCRVGDICCNADTQVTYECQDVNGCTMWILTGNACTPTLRNRC